LAAFAILISVDGFKSSSAAFMVMNAQIAHITVHKINVLQGKIKNIFKA
jgi:hypothetical protein